MTSSSAFSDITDDTTNCLLLPRKGGTCDLLSLHSDPTPSCCVCVTCSFLLGHLLPVHHADSSTVVTMNPALIHCTYWLLAQRHSFFLLSFSINKLVRSLKSWQTHSTRLKPISAELTSGHCFLQPSSSVHNGQRSCQMVLLTLHLLSGSEVHLVCSTAWVVRRRSSWGEKMSCAIKWLWHLSVTCFFTLNTHYLTGNIQAYIQVQCKKKILTDYENSHSGEKTITFGQN